AQIADAGVVGGAFGAAIPAMVVAGPVVVAVAVLLVVLVVRADEVVQGEAVVAGDEVDAGIGPPAALLVKIAAAAEARGEFGGGGAVALPAAAHRVAGFVV